MLSLAQRLLCRKRSRAAEEEGEDVSGIDIEAQDSHGGVNINAMVVLCHMPLFRAPSDHHLAAAAAFQQWINQCGLHTYFDLSRECEQPDLHRCLLKIRIAGIPANPGLDRSDHGRPFQRVMYHGTVISHLPAIVSAGCLLRSSVPTRGHHCIWAGTSPERALMYAPPVRMGNKHMVCIIRLQAARVKSSHFRASDTDAQLMLRECWHETTHVYIIEYRANQTLYRRSVPSLSQQLPHFFWQNEYANWNRLPSPWVVSNSDDIPPASQGHVHGLPLP
jgi:hypothetical protein